MIIYSVLNKVNGKKYIGQTGQSVEDRFQDHINQSRAKTCRYENPLYHAFRKYGINQFEIKILDTANSQQELNEKEIFYIALHKTMLKEFGYNRHEGGNKPPLSTPESRRKAGAKLKGRAFSDGHRKAISRSLTGRKFSPEHIANMSGRKRPHSDATKLKMSKTRKGRKQTPEWTARIAAALTGKIHSEETKKKISMSKRNPSAETREKMRTSHLGKKQDPEVVKKRIRATLKTKAAKKLLILPALPGGSTPSFFDCQCGLFPASALAQPITHWSNFANRDSCIQCRQNLWQDLK